ncbi:MAG: hypothetical protein KBD07_01080 [Candidatus Omnitrophica bacterium]|jgi:hypothetical protein|nr:hypothetical protein [Candidatus Omnitrophota bacterium]
MREKKQKVLFMMTPGRKHLVVEFDEDYDQRELNVLLRAFRKKLLAGEPAAGGSKGSGVAGRGRNQVDRIVGPGFVIEMLGASLRAGNSY